jgi:hypothetical protein
MGPVVPVTRLARDVVKDGESVRHTTALRDDNTDVGITPSRDVPVRHKVMTATIRDDEGGRRS